MVCLWHGIIGDRYAEYIMGYRSFGVDIMFTLFTPTPFSRGVVESVGIHRCGGGNMVRTAVRVVLCQPAGWRVIVLRCVLYWPACGLAGYCAAVQCVEWLKRCLMMWYTTIKDGGW